MKKTTYKRKVYVVWGSGYDANWMQGERVYNIEDADLVVFTGGADINPELYNKNYHWSTHPDKYRDKIEVAAFKKAMSLNKKIIGICRGAQLLCAMAGGILVQDSKHPYVHKVMTSDGQEIYVTSAHHQQQFPYESQTSQPVEFELIGWSDSLSPYMFGVSDKDVLKGHPEVEIAIYPKINSLAIQSHPEWAFDMKEPWEKDFIKYSRKLLDQHMGENYSQKKLAA